jgi:phosphatidylglycerol---prolipoprotein diacylglyceryl transferase
MLQELFRVPWLDLPIYGYGAMLVVGFLLAAHWAKFLARRCGLDGEVFINAALLALISGILGARLSHILENLPDYTRADAWTNFKKAINLREGGLTYYGGFLLAFPTLVVYAMKKKLPLRLGMDIVAPCIMIGLGFGRVGCFLNGCCYGARCDAPYAVRFPYHSIPYNDQFDKELLRPPQELIGRTKDPKTKEEKQIPLPPAKVAGDTKLVSLAKQQRSLPVHPAQLYSTITALLLAAMLTAYFTLPHAAGRVFALMLILEGASRFLLEMLRSEPARWGNLSLSMVIGLGLTALGIALWIFFGQLARSHPAPALANAK